MKEKWRPLKRVAVAAGGRWPTVADALIVRDLDESAAEREAGLRTLPPGIHQNSDYWGNQSPYGKQLTEMRLGKLLAQAAKVTPGRIGGAGLRGYVRSGLEPAWHRLGIPSGEAGELGEAGEAGDKSGDDNRLNRINRLNRLQSDTSCDVLDFTPPSGPGRCPECGCHVPTQGHKPDCRSAKGRQ